MIWKRTTGAILGYIHETKLFPDYQIEDRVINGYKSKLLSYSENGKMNHRYFKTLKDAKQYAEEREQSNK